MASEMNNTSPEDVIEMMEEVIESGGGGDGETGGGGEGGEGETGGEGGENEGVAMMEEVVETGGGGEGGDEERGNGLRLPISRVKKIMKADPDLNLTSQDAVYVLTKATELFVESLVQEAYQFTCQARKKTMSRRDIDNCIEAIEALAFLDGALE
ncbi:hypothetical protein Pmani_035477 [Petrolisthes manimaculis]|uniref:Transcription factor CBF/NF-Y/archaeal histone domain-containing protein n=1 Tax=Petrolisthes manimaculis TaxID=1843537 RepID=A0AAE1TQF7_9EUCA|nr:hypothetical protein Pmani_035477 [Petrolisthes manimaculis]